MTQDRAEYLCSASSSLDFKYLGGEHVDSACLVTEIALSISYQGVNHAVMMVTPVALDDFILGFSLSENIISSAVSLKDIDYQVTKMGIEANVTIHERDFAQLKRQRRQLSGRTGCGICGLEALENLLSPALPVAKSALPDLRVLTDLAPKLREWQQYGQISGALHGAFFVYYNGEIKACREDVGRHNALDKLIGHLIATKLDPDTGFIVMTSRCSYELIQKIARTGFSTLVCLSAPTNLAVSWAEKHNINLLHLTKHDAPRVYSRGV
ncbi:formate dehydrogenase accessory sulfurtransferase FdhD [Shewanella sp. D64]|uniref:formate dehydrogenase accessory sulfurtransferase FdhD n=1 Tax=unclassified Shewanella TaxID=196818 RepID=UPI0022BA2A2C|nr:MULTISPECIES: formate dehydrogenase accessory sulfurtransferase FdhD [unclassified Shewanella]MEC4725505.1 formate dehydrogenase accessory sulfurtransferase FdhD [Shewanella sp. D64]MEC4738676.1 formate dehydrogenase accessory sulfurtransferase FdhD [Shewanella sp. E94]WBJ94973.1 formate dehydrogenase accessory sulfurtransferase FdhD [Shewanella sp. MTB7]